MKEIEKPGSDIQSYVNQLDKIMEEKELRIKDIRTNIAKMKEMLKKEQVLSKYVDNSEVNDVLI